jgi:hypothetical protein
VEVGKSGQPDPGDRHPPNRSPDRALDDATAIRDRRRRYRSAEVEAQAVMIGKIAELDALGRIASHRGIICSRADGKDHIRLSCRSDRSSTGAGLPSLYGRAVVMPADCRFLWAFRHKQPYRYPRLQTRRPCLVV